LTNFSNTARNIYCQEIVKPRWRTTVNAVVIICFAVSIGVAGMAGGKIIPLIGFRGMFTIGAALALLAVLLFFAWQLKSSGGATVPELVESG
jgi:predicted MFS family arabinose efflux permease